MRTMTVSQSLTAAHELAKHGERHLLGLTGEPGVGKSTLAALLAADLGAAAVAVSMDGFHLAQKELERLGRASRKGAPDTFDSWGFLSLMQRLTTNDAPAVYAPEYHRELHNPVAGAIRVDKHVPLVIAEGNYLLLPGRPWGLAHDMFDEIWFLQTNQDLRHKRLINRHMAFGKTAQHAERWTLGPDERNARTVRAQIGRADAVIELS
ncbi:nucleoside/nucleotide kinase family protein [Propionibacterium freudenreichii]|jgi:pantothenate kinase|uniref:Panthothenate kinase n=2 Tax=Propionibacterium freudenreichii TaxID=1744 RepID=A0A2C7AVH6_9ACTN|nr:nucleoside/nucleotide kinase family protein [Propionibacterium freudenreichii]CEG94449.1 Pantothenate kinase [Propionibacterium freudenreichii]CUW05505.1 Putative fructose transport system kinase [Propionibacterium freudenreichii subsp. shermanii]SBT30117.1 Panthothenate kinase [Propionibacterium freudenreichii]SPB29837.1 Panthothenate kinase [Propionibacterium freudenreichii subsp. shermanii]SPS07816.1 Panthothenate kinase [Propionibacterium freudenreichii subsp. shermanii]